MEASAGSSQPCVQLTLGRPAIRHGWQHGPRTSREWQRARAVEGRRTECRFVCSLDMSSCLCAYSCEAQFLVNGPFGSGKACPISMLCTDHGPLACQTCLVRIGAILDNGH